MNNEKTEVAIPAASKPVTGVTGEKHDNIPVTTTSTTTTTTSISNVVPNQSPGIDGGLGKQKDKSSPKKTGKSPGKKWQEKATSADGCVKCNKCSKLVPKEELKQHNKSHRKGKNSPAEQAMTKEIAKLAEQAAGNTRLQWSISGRRAVFLM